MKASSVLIFTCIYLSRCDGESSVNIINNAVNHVLTGTSYTLKCHFLLNDIDILTAIDWGMGEDLTTVAVYLPDTHDLTHYPSERASDYTMTFDITDQGGTTNYTIHRAKPADNGTFQCSILFGQFVDETDSDTAAVIINVPPTSTILSNDDSSNIYPNKTSVEVTEGQETSLRCTAGGHTPEATIRWTVNGQQQADWPDGINTSVVTFVPNWGNHGDIIECNAMVPADPIGINTQISLDVKVPPTASKLILSDENNRYGYNDSTETTGVLKDKMHQMSCFIEGTRPEPKVLWRLGGIDQTDGVTTSSTTNPTDQLLHDTISTFTFTASQCSSYNNQVVECEAKLDGTMEVSKSATLRLYVTPDVPVISHGTLKENISHIILCESINGYPEEGDMWWKISDGQVTKRNPTFDTDDTTCRADMTSRYNYTPVRSDNGKTITCEVHHPSSFTSIPSNPVILDVQFCSNSITGPQQSECDQPMLAGSQSPVFPCTSESSNPETELAWYLDGEMQENTHTPEHFSGVNNGKITTLEFQINELDKTHNGVALQCRGSHRSITTCTNDRSTGCTLIVQYPPTITEIKATPSTTDEGNDVELTCGADANPQPDKFVSWYKDRTKLDGTYTSGKNVLQLTNIDRIEAGTYQCKAENDISMDTGAVNVTVHYAPNITNKDDYSRGADEGSEAILLCRSQSNPESTTSWFDANGNELVNGEGRITILNTIISGNGVIGITMESELRISNVQPSTDYGNYSCSVSNDKGSDSFSIHLNGTRRPDDVKDPRVTASSLTNLTLEWIPGYDGGEDQWYLVSYRKLSTEDFSDYERQNYSSHTFQGLAPGTEYEFIIFSENQHGKSKHGVKVLGRTRQIPDPPMSVNIDEAEVNSISISWIPGNDGGDEQWFLLDYGKERDGLSGTKYRLTNPQNQNRHTLENLSSGTTYIIEVYSENRNGINKDGERAIGDTTANTSPPISVPSSTIAIIAGSVVGILLLFIILGLIVVLFKQTNTSSKDNTTVPLEVNDSDSNNGGITNTSVTDVKETAVDGGDVYSKVNKKRKQVPKSDNVAELYAKVDKRDKSAKADNVSQLYAKVNKNGGAGEEESYYDDVANVQGATGNQSNVDEKSVGPDGIIYTEVGHFKPVPADAPPIRTEECTEYAELNFVKMKSGQN